MIIGFDASRAFTPNRTGTENYSYQILKNLSLIDTKNSYFVYLRPSVKIDQRDWPKNFHFFTLNFPYLWTQAGLCLQSLKDPLDILFVPAHTLPLLRKPGLKTVVTVHDLGAQYLPQAHQLKQRLYLNFITHYQLKSATHLISVSQATKKDLVSKVGLPKAKVTVIYEGINQSLKRVSGGHLNNILGKYDLSPGSYFLFVGTIQPRKNLKRLIQAFSRWLTADSQKPEARSLPILALAGSKGWLADEIYTLPKELGAEAQVRFLGYVPDPDLPALYSGAQAFLFPSLFEGFGLPILEALSCGCPVLTSNLSSMPEVAGEAAILVDPYSVESIAKGIMMVSQKSTTTKLIPKGFKQLRRFSWEKAARETLKVLEKVANLKSIS